MKKLITFICLMYMLAIIMPTNVSANSVIDRTITTNFGKSTMAFTLRNLATGKVVYEKSGNYPMAPASSLKTVTGAAALHYLGADFKFHTYLYYSGSITNGTLNGNVYLKGEGDPTLQAKDFTHFAGVLKRLGISKINGHILGDDSLFVGSQLSPGVLPSYEGDYYAAPISALNMSVDADYDANTVKVQVKAGRVGSAPAVAILPNASGLRIINQAKTVAKGQGTNISVQRKRGTNQIIVSGRIVVGGSSTQLVAVQNATMSTLQAFANVLKANGIQFSPTTKITYGQVPADATKIQTKTSMPLSQLMTPFMKLSNNPIADILTKTIGYHVYGVGDLAHGTKAIQDYLAQQGVDSSKWTIVDGSGLSARNKVTTNDLTQFFVHAKNTTTYKILLNSLPVGGQGDKFVGGSLKSRFTQAAVRNRVIAKTGYIPGAASLSGYVRGKSGNWYTFSVMTSKPSASGSIDTLLKRVIDQY